MATKSFDSRIAALWSLIEANEAGIKAIKRNVKELCKGTARPPTAPYPAPTPTTTQPTEIPTTQPTTIPTTHTHITLLWQSQCDFH